MLRKAMMAALAVAAVGLSMPQMAEARGFGHGGGWGHGGGGWGHGGHGHWHGGGFWPGVAIGAGLAGAGYYGAYYTAMAPPITAIPTIMAPAMTMAVTAAAMSYASA